MDNAETLLKLRQRMLDLQKLGMLTPESFGMYQQTVLQIWQEAERRRQTCMAQAENFREQARAAEAQAHAFSAMASIMYAVVNGYIQLEEKRVAEEAERKKEASSSPTKRRKKNDPSMPPASEG